VDRAKKRVFDPDDSPLKEIGYGLAPWRCRALAPDTYRVRGSRGSEFDLIACKLKDAPDAGLSQEPPIENEKPPGFGAGGFGR
jgi:hypothetical protein